MHISIHAPARGATSPFFFWPIAVKFQSTLPRGERLIPKFFIGFELISIHAPARGATHRPDIYYYRIPISIHAPARGATTEFLTGFNKWKISIHAPARGATILMRAVPLFVAFQSTLPRGERPISDATRASSFQFQSTLPRGERPHRPDTYYYRIPISIHAPARGATRHTLYHSNF